MADAPHSGRSRPWLPALVLAVLHLSCSLRTAQAQALDYPTAALATAWTSNRTMPHVVDFQDGSQVRSLLLRLNRERFGSSYAFGFYCKGACQTFLLSIFIVQANSGGRITLPSIGFPQVVWAANRGRPVGENATLQLGSDGDLVLADADGTRVWSTGTSGKSVAGINLTDNGNLVLFGGPNNQTIWDSFSSPTDSLVPGQKLLVGQNLKANSSDTNSSEGLYYLSATPTKLVAYIKSATTNRYASLPSSNEKVDYFVFMNGSISTSASGQYLPPSQFLRLESDGHLRVYNWSSGWSVVSDLLTPSWPPFAACFYPTACGRYGICSGSNQCACPRDGGGANYFVQAVDRKPDLGCIAVNPLSCRSPYNHTLLQLENVAYFTYEQDKDVGKMDGAKCANLCASNCSCGAAFFQYFTDRSVGNCYLATDVFSLKNNQDDVTHYNSTAFIKVQIAANSSGVTSPASGSGASGSSKGVILGSSLGGALFMGLIVICVLMARKRIRDKKEAEAEEEEEDLEMVSGTPRRFSFEELQTATEGFKKELGKGGFGSVYEGTIDGRTVAVKRLDGAHQGKKEFLAEVQTIGRIHHVNLVKLIGFCATKSRRLLVYEFMPNGSLDRWIFLPRDDQQKKASSLDWQTRCKIILGVAKALAYLHEECSQRIAHLDIKPQNILLDERFEAKVSDFGLAKLIDRDQTHVETRMRGTPGYLAPEWLSSMITEKADVYSFGIVVLEIICGRRNLDRSRPEEDVVLVNLVSRKAASGELLSLVDERIREADCRAEGLEAVRMVQIARGCLQEQNRRPSMSAVVKALEGTAEVDPDVAENHPMTTAYQLDYSSGCDTGSTPLLPSLLSGPR